VAAGAGVTGAGVTGAGGVVGAGVLGGVAGAGVLGGVAGAGVAPVVAGAGGVAAGGSVGAAVVVGAVAGGAEFVVTSHAVSATNELIERAETTPANRNAEGVDVRYMSTPIHRIRPRRRAFARRTW
jgi:hypothetical protein